MKLIPNLLFTISLILWFSLYNPPPTKAEITTNDNHTIQIDKVNISNKSSSPTKTPKKETPPDLPEGTSIGTNYKIQTGLSDRNPLGSFSFSISNNLIDYGFISPTNPIYRTSNLTISGNAIKKFIVVGYANHPLTTQDSNSQIPDSTCDNGSCSETTAALWTNALTYGFGFRCEDVTGTNCSKDMKASNYYKQLSDLTKNEPSQNIMTGSLAKNQSNEIQITYKINTSKTQEKNIYANAITYIAAPDY